MLYYQHYLPQGNWLTFACLLVEQTEIQYLFIIKTNNTLQTAGSEFSFQTLVPGQDSGFLHSHKTHEELYFILKGEGEYQVDGEVFPVTEGSIIRVAPEGKRALKNTGNDELLMLCIQYKANSFGEEDAPMNDGVILNDELKW